ncbi:hypothetical protein TNCV_204611 [Trichonephila clavipes]|nr:hypothetical protein TNCV_204611 [Trichonephila clavipes]
MATASAVKSARSVEPITVHNIFNHDSTANVICTFRTISVDGRITTIPDCGGRRRRVERRQALQWFTVKGDLLVNPRSNGEARRRFEEQVPGAHLANRFDLPNTASKSFLN